MFKTWKVKIEKIIILTKILNQKKYKEILNETKFY